jgi:hypothetical protein
LTVTLKPSTHAQLLEVSRLTGNSLSGMVAEILEQSEPVFARLVQVLTAAEQAKQEVKDRMGSDLASAQARIEKQLGLAFGELEAYTGNLLNEVEEVRRRARREPRGATLAGGTRRAALPSTPPSNRGVRSTANPPKRANSKKGPTHGQV